MNQMLAALCRRSPRRRQRLSSPPHDPSFPARILCFGSVMFQIPYRENLLCAGGVYFCLAFGVLLFAAIDPRLFSGGVSHLRDEK